MKREKIKADNVEQLMEIVRSLQRGEEPTQESIRRSSAAPSASGRASGVSSASGQASGASSASGQTSVASSASGKDTDVSSASGKSSGVSKKARFWRRSRSRQDAEEYSGDRAEGSREAFEEESEDWREASAEEPEDHMRSSGDKYGSRRRTSEEALEDLPENRGTIAGDEEDSWEDDSDLFGEEREDSAILGQIAGLFTGLRQKVSGLTERRKIRPRTRAEWPDEEEAEESDGDALKDPPKETKRRTSEELMEEGSEERLDETSGSFSDKRKSKESEGSSDKRKKEESEGSSDKWRKEESGGSSDKRKKEESEGSSDKRKKEESEGSSDKRRKEESEGPSDKQKKKEPGKSSERQKRRTRSGAPDFLEGLREKGISSRELVMLGVGAVLALLLLVIVVRAVFGVFDRRHKSRNVSADDGLRVTVEAEPEQWCHSYPVKLKFSDSDGPVTQVRVNGETYVPDEEGIVTVEVSDWLLNAEAVTEKGTKNARIEIPCLDGDAPSLHAALKEDLIELSAADARSEVAGIYYAEVQENAYQKLPHFQKYEQPFAYRENMIYYFYAQDQAGNRSVPVETRMRRPERLVLEPEALSVGPGETASLSAAVSPDGAILENLQYESMNPELLSVDEHGQVTGLAEGTGTVRVSADGVEDVICTVTVANTRTATISLLGDCTLGTDDSFNPSMSFNAFDTMNGHSYFFQNVKSILEEDDATFANLEGTFTDSTDRAQKQYAFKGDASYTDILLNGSVDVVTLANNHTGDFGEQGLSDTMDALDAAGIDHCSGDRYVLKDVNGIQTAFIGIFVLDDGTEQEALAREVIAEARSKGAQLVIVAFHWGAEKATQPDPVQQRVAHAAIDAGADLVVGHHPHVLQAIEKYNGKYIAYSLGNFCFGGNSYPADMDTVIFRQTFTVTGGTVVDDDAVTVIPCRISSDQGYNNYQPTPAEGGTADAIIQKLNSYSSAYGVTVASDGSVTAE